MQDRTKTEEQDPTILIIDDDPDNLAMMTDYLKDRNCRILVAKDGEGGIRMAVIARPDLIVLTVQMPHVDGIETCRRLKAIESTRDIPVIFLTALTETQHKIRAFEVGAVDYITKPAQREEIQARVDAHLHIQELRKRIQEANELLEQRVKERTAELASANMELETEIAERKRAEDMLRESELKFRMVADFTYDWEFWRGSDGSYIYVSPSCERITGYRAEEFLADPDLMVAITHPDDRELISRHLREALDARTPESIDYRIMTRDGDTRWVTHACGPVSDTDGRLLGRRGSNRDITERKQAEEALNRLNQMVDLATDAVIICEFNEEQIEYWNQGAERLYGWTKEEAIGKYIHTFLQTEFPWPLPEITEKVLREGYWEGELTQTRSDGQRVVVMSCWTLQRDERGVPTTFLEINTNITERKSTEDMLRESETRLRSIYESVHAGIMLIDAETCRIVHANPVAVKLIGEPLEKIIGSVCHNYVCPAEVGKCPVTDLGQTVDNSERILLASGGKKIPVIKTVVPMTIGGRNHLLESFIDITERKKAEEQVRTSEERFRSVAQTANDAIVVANGEGTITVWNKGAQKIFGYTEDETLGKPITILMPERYHQGHREGNGAIPWHPGSWLSGKWLNWLA